MKKLSTVLILMVIVSLTACGTLSKLTDSKSGIKENSQHILDIASEDLQSSQSYDNQIELRRMYNTIRTKCSTPKVNIKSVEIIIDGRSVVVVQSTWLYKINDEITYKVIIQNDEIKSIDTVIFDNEGKEKFPW